MQIGTRFRCYPTPAQEQTLLQWIGCQRFIYNAKVGEDRYFPWFSEVPSAVLWKQAYSRYFSKLGARPVIHNRHGKQSVWLTSELFQFAPVVVAETGEITGHQLHIGIKKFAVGVLAFKAHKDYKLPASLHISLHAGQWHVSFSTDDNIPEPSDKDITAWLMQFDEAELRTMTVGLDRGVAIPVAVSDGQTFDFSLIQKSRLAQNTATKKRWQVFLQYKARRQGKLCLDVPPHYSSQECAACGHVHKDNRISQAEFVCQCCGNSANADSNASQVIAQRGVKRRLSGQPNRKEKKTCRITQSKKIGAESSESAGGSPLTLGETAVSRGRWQHFCARVGEPRNPHLQTEGLRWWEISFARNQIVWP